jgi:protein involved in polysaccharide export with SLBB domain
MTAISSPAPAAVGERDEETEKPVPTLTEEERKQLSEAEIRKGLPAIHQAGAIDAAHYVMGPGDVLELSLWGRLTRSVLIPVSPEGTVLLPGSGPIKVAERTLAWSRQQILDQVSRSFRGVQAEVRLVQLRTFKIFITGFVKRPGAVPVTSVTRASEAVSGLEFAEKASRRNIVIRRRDGTSLRLDLETFEATGRRDADPTLVDGDVIVVPRATEFLGVWGAVARTGRFERAPGDSLSTLIRLGGGLLPWAVTDRALVVRFPTPSTRESLWVNLAALQQGQQDITLQDGDELFVSLRSDFHELPVVTILGEVERPGSYPIALGRDRFSNLIEWAGGFRPLANRSGIHLVRETGGPEADPEFERLVRLSRSEMTESEYTKFQTRLAERKNSFRIDWSRVQKQRVDVDPLLQDGDVVRVDQLVSTVRVEGQVKRPGFVDYAPGRSLREYVELSGGFTDHASHRNISVARSLTGQVIPARSLASVQPGDFVWVPERKDVDAWSVFRDVITVAGQIALVIFTLSR